MQKHKTDERFSLPTTKRQAPITSQTSKLKLTEVTGPGSTCRPLRVDDEQAAPAKPQTPLVHGNPSNTKYTYKDWSAALTTTLSAQESQLVNTAWQCTTLGEVQIEYGNLYVAHMISLSGSKWLGGEVISQAIQLLKDGQRRKPIGEQILIADTHLKANLVNKNKTLAVTTAVWNSRKHQVNIFDYKCLCIPWNYAHSHWALAIIDWQHDRFIYQDPLGTAADSTVFDHLQRLVEHQYAQSHSAHIQHTPPSTWTRINGIAPEQTDNYNCGVYVLRYILAITEGEDPQQLVCTMTEEQANLFRRFIAYQLLVATRPAGPI